MPDLSGEQVFYSRRAGAVDILLPLLWMTQVSGGLDRSGVRRDPVRLHVTCVLAQGKFRGSGF